MATVTQHPRGVSDLVTSHTAVAQPAPALRRAVYVHVSDLTSAYDIDHAMLEEELDRVKEESSLASDKLEDPSLAVATTTVLGVPTELDTSTSKRRLHPPRTGYNLCVLVGKVSVVVDKKRVDGTRVRLAEVEVGDETGIVSFRARDNQIDILEEVSSRSGAVVIRNSTLELYQGRHIRLAVTKWGKLSRFPDQIASTPPPPSKINRERNFSLIDLSKVASEMVHYPLSTEQQGLETENQANRSHPHSNLGRRGRRPPTSTRPKSAPGHFADATLGLLGSGPAVTYPATGLHGYGGSGAYVYPHLQPDNLHPKQQQHQQITLRQQYEMQQHHRPTHQPPPSRASAYQGHPVPHAMINPGVVPPTSSFDSAQFGMTSNPFMTPIHSSSASSSSAANQAPAASSDDRADSPHGKMNPQAATFDPSSYRK